jgi:GNAT superfamily N-acetyltransferase
MKQLQPCVIRPLAAASDAEIDALAELLIDCVQGGASVSFMAPLPRARAAAFWRAASAAVVRGERVLLVAEDSDGIVGTVQLILQQPQNQPHRADVAKMLVHRRARRQGVGAALMRAAEAAALGAGKSLLVLDTASATAERLYLRLGWERCGVIPDYALLPRGGYCDTTVLYRRLTPPSPRGGNPLQSPNTDPT